MTPRYQTINLKLDVAARARALAEANKLPLAALLADLIDDAYRKQFGETLARVAEVTTDAGTDLAISLSGESGERSVYIPKAHALNVAQRIADFANPNPRERVYLDLDLECMLTVSRRGVAVVIEAIDRQGQKVRQTMSTREAEQLASEIKKFAK